LVDIPVATEVASEFRYRHAYLDDNTLLIAISQSGETADTLAALKTARQKSQSPILGDLQCTAKLFGARVPSTHANRRRY